MVALDLRCSGTGARTILIEMLNKLDKTDSTDLMK
jgi:hypothetical protein